jgi:hypothetical protein
MRLPQHIKSCRWTISLNMRNVILEERRLETAHAIFRTKAIFPVARFVNLKVAHGDLYMLD